MLRVQESVQRSVLKKEASCGSGLQCFTGLFFG
jgi:hypothetical protein